MLSSTEACTQTNSRFSDAGVACLHAWDMTSAHMLKGSQPYAAHPAQQVATRYGATRPGLYAAV